MNQPGNRLEFGPVTLIPDERLVLKDGQPLPFTPKAFDLLSVLASNPGRLLTKEQLMQAVWPDTVVEESNLTYHIFAIRKGLGDDGETERYIETVPKRGYRFVAPVPRADADGAQLPDVPASPDIGVPVAVSTVVRRWPAMLGVGAAVLIGALMVGFGSMRRGDSTPIGPVTVFEDAVRGRLAETGMFAVAPDGGAYVYAAEGDDGVLRLWMRSFDAVVPEAIPESEVFTIVPPAVWSPDSRSVAFNPPGVLKKASVYGGVPQAVCAFGTAVGGSWSGNGHILVGNAGDASGGRAGLVLCSSSGGSATTVTTLEEPASERHVFPSFLSDGRRFIYLRVFRTDPQASGIYVGELSAVRDTTGENRTAPLPAEPLIATGFNASFVRSADGRPPLIVFARDGSLFAQRFDEARMALLGDEMKIADRLGSYLDGAFFSVSPTTLMFREPVPDFQLAWLDRRGGELERVGPPARYADLALSPKGTAVVVAVHEPQGATSQDLWLFEMSRSGNPRKVTFDSEIERGVVFSGDETFIFGSGAGLTGAYQQTIGGSRRLLFDGGRPFVPSSVTADERVLLFGTFGMDPPGGDIWAAIRTAGGYTVAPLIQGVGNQSDARLSPGGHRVAWVTDEGGRNEVFVGDMKIDAARGSVTVVGATRVSHGGGYAPRWRPDGRELLYLTPDGGVMAVGVDKGGSTPGNPQRLFTRPNMLPQWDVGPDGDRFLFAVPVAPPPPFKVVRNWQATLPH